MAAFIWYWQHYVLRVQRVDTDDWVSTCWQWDQSDDHALYGIEVDGEWHHRDAVRKMPGYNEHERRASQDARSWAQDRPNWRVIELRHPEQTDWAWYSTVRADEADNALAELRAVVGTDRARIASR